eukprot:9186624-Pyramimonas_sp.AAC.1
MCLGASPTPEVPVERRARASCKRVDGPAQESEQPSVRAVPLATAATCRVFAKHDAHVAPLRAHIDHWHD